MIFTKTLGEAWVRALKEIQENGEIEHDGGATPLNLLMSMEEAKSHPQFDEAKRRFNILQIKNIPNMQIGILDISNNDPIIKEYANQKWIDYTVKRYGPNTSPGGYGERIYAGTKKALEELSSTAKGQPNRQLLSGEIQAMRELGFGGNFEMGALSYDGLNIPMGSIPMDTFIDLTLPSDYPQSPNNGDGIHVLNKSASMIFKNNETDANTVKAVLQRKKSKFDPDAPKNKVPPCCMGIGFKVYGNKLDMQPFYRAQSIYRKQPGNLLGLRLLHERMAQDLGLGVGDTFITIGNAHIYETEYDKVSSLLESENVKKIL